MKFYGILLIIGLCCLTSCGNNVREHFLIVPETKDLTITTDTTPTCTGKIIMDKQVVL
jgi:hypothetical protein